jgi:hypothetical protein
MSIGHIIASVNRMHGSARDQQAKHASYLEWVKLKREKAVSEIPTLVGRTFYCGTRKVIVTGEYNDGGLGEAPGYYYHYFDEPGITKWITATSMAVRWTKEPTND